MRLLMSTDTVGGVWTYALDLVRALRQHGVEVALATMGPRPSEGQRAEARAAGAAALHESDFALEWSDEPWQDLESAGDWLRALAGSEGADAVHLNSYAHGAVDFGRPAIVVAHSCVCSWWRAVHGEQAPPAWDRYRAAVRDGLAGAGAVVAPTRAMLAALEREYGVGGGLAIHNASSAAMANGPAKEPLVAAAGRVWDEAKNLAALDGAAAGLEWPVLVAGEPGSGETDAARVLGRLERPEVQRLLRRASVFAHPALYEPFGLAPLEAARAGCALVLGDIPSLREVWGDAALYADPRERSALRARLDALIGDPGLRAEMAARARARSARYGLERTGRRYARLYARLADRAAVTA